MVSFIFLTSLKVPVQALRELQNTPTVTPDYDPP